MQIDTSLPVDPVASFGVSHQQLTRSEEKELSELKKRDREVRQHEMAHRAAAGSHARGGATFEFTTGPDGRRYAVGGEVSIDTSAVRGDPSATVQKMRRVQRAALAPADPSPQDRRVAAEAARKASEAQRELAQQARAEAAPEPGQLLDLFA